MKQTETCPKCRSRKLFVVDEVQRRHEMGMAESVVPVTVTAAQLGIGPSSLFAGAQNKNVEAGRYEAWICASCGYTEWYATRLQELAILAGGTSAVRIIDREPEGGPYRT